MYRRLIFLGLLFLFSKVQGQDTLTFPVIDQYTYKYYNEGQWDDLIRLGKIARHKNLDFYFLQVRMGVAYFHKKKYLKAIKYLEKAYRTDSKNPVVNKYLYLAYKYTFLENEAARMIKKMNGSAFAVSDSGFRSLSVNYGYGFNRDFESVSDTNMISGNEIEASRDVMKQENLFDFRYLQWPSGGLSIKYNLSIYNVGYRRTVQTLLGGVRQVDLKTSQKQLFVEPAIPLGRRWLFVPAVSLLWGYTQDEELVYPRQPYMPPKLQIVNLNYTKFLASIMFRKTGTFYENNTNITIANLEKSNNLQVGNAFSLLPFRNRKLSLTFDVQLKSDSVRRFKMVKTLALSSYFKRFGLSGFYTIGRIHNYTELNGQVVYNMKENMTGQSGFTGKLFLKNLTIFTSVIRQTYMDFYTVHLSDGTESNKMYKFDNLFFRGGILWQF